MQQVPQKIQKEARNTENFSVVFVLKSRHERDYKKITRQKYFWDNFHFADDFYLLENLRFSYSKHYVWQRAWIIHTRGDCRRKGSISGHFVVIFSIGILFKRHIYADWQGFFKLFVLGGNDKLHDFCDFIFWTFKRIYLKKNVLNFHGSDNQRLYVQPLVVQLHFSVFLLNGLRTDGILGGDTVFGQICKDKKWKTFVFCGITFGIIFCFQGRIYAYADNFFGGVILEELFERKNKNYFNNKFTDFPDNHNGFADFAGSKNQRYCKLFFIYLKFFPHKINDIFLSKHRNFVCTNEHSDVH